MPALVMSCLRAGLARARYVSNSGYPNTFSKECYRVPCFFYAYSGRIFPTFPSRVMEPRRVLLPLRTIAAPADCTCPRTGSGRNRYVSAAPAWTGTPGLAAQNCKPCLSVAANKSCLTGWFLSYWSCGPAPYINGPHVCAASMGWVLQPAPGAASILTMGQRRCFGMVAPVFSINYIFACWHETKNGADGTLAPRPRMFLAKGNESHKHNRQSGQQ